MTNNSSEYDKIASEYYSTDFSSSIEDYTFRHIILKNVLNENGLLKGQRVLDLACGHGLYTRELKSLECDYILGVDISSEMIKIAKDIEFKNPKGIEYMVSDAKDIIKPDKPYDLVSACYLLCYAKTKQELQQMVDKIYEQLGENKYFITLTDNVMATKDSFGKINNGILKEINNLSNYQQIPEGAQINITFFDKQNKPLCQIINYYLSPNTYEQVFKQAGFKEFKWIYCHYDQNKNQNQTYQDFINSTNGIGIIAKK